MLEGARWTLGEGDELPRPDPPEDTPELDPREEPRLASRAAHEPEPQSATTMLKHIKCFPNAHMVVSPSPCSFLQPYNLAAVQPR